jgi:small redox-active disulfide protein 2
VELKIFASSGGEVVRRPFMTDQNVTRIKVGKHPVGIMGLEENLKEVAGAMKGAPDEKIQEELLKRLSKINYIGSNTRELYGQAFLREYKKFIGDSFTEPNSSGVEIKVLGPGCPQCDRLEKDLIGLVAELKVDADLEHIRDIAEIGNYGVMGSPALVINGEVKAVGVVPSRAKLKAWIEQAISVAVGDG